MKLFCKLVGVNGGAFPVRVDADDTVAELKELIKAKSPGSVEVDAHLLDLYLGKKGDAWLSSSDDDLKRLSKRGRAARSLRKPT